tara:strand:+ start:6572 stop:7387 length:816 start_codon:yes stop_codon:yes gene_type:complete
LLYRQIFSDNDDEFDAVWGIAECFHSLGEISLAIEWYKKYLEFEPDEPETMHMLAALGEGVPPTRASNAYLIAHFDRFAEDFDKHLIEELNYRVPDLICAAFQSDYVKFNQEPVVLDAGCGTGLCGELLSPHVERIDGVDLSNEMLKYAQRRGCYNTLFEDELGRFLSQTNCRYDSVISGDAICYFGDLKILFNCTARVLKENGIFIFSVENCASVSDFKLTQSGRYVHGQYYIRQVAAGAGFNVVSRTSDDLRTEYGEPVLGDLWILAKL